MKPTVLALDFDGVISDSAIESFVVALRTYADMCPGGRVAAACSRLASAEAGAVRESPLYRDFLDMMPLGNRAEDFGVVLAILDAGRHADDQAAYDSWRASRTASFLETFHERFYLERAAMRDDDPDAWASLLAPFGWLVALLRRRAEDATLCIATAKDRPSVDVLLERYGIADLFAAEHVADKGHGRSKRAHLTTLRDRLGVTFGDITFVDDKLNHLQDVEDLGVRGVLAGWGYNAEREHRLARDAGFEVCGEDDAEPVLFGPAARSGRGGAVR